MTIYKEVKKECTEQIPVSVICDRCQREIKEHEEKLEIRHEFGYGTSHDGDYIETEICEDCLLEILKNSNVKYRLFKGQ